MPFAAGEPLWNSAKFPKKIPRDLDEFAALHEGKFIAAQSSYANIDAGRPLACPPGSSLRCPNDSESRGLNQAKSYATAAFQKAQRSLTEPLITSKNHASFIYNRLRWDSPGGVQTQATNTYAIDGFGNDFVKLDYGLAKLDTIITSSIANEVRYQYGRELNNESSQPLSAYDAQFVNGTSFEGLPPTISLQSSNGFSSGVQYYAFRPAFPERKWQVADTVSWIHGQHSLKFGGDIVHNYDLINTLGWLPALQTAALPTHIWVTFLRIWRNRAEPADRVPASTTLEHYLAIQRLARISDRPFSV